MMEMDGVMSRGWMDRWLVIHIEQWRVDRRMGMDSFIRR